MLQDNDLVQSVLITQFRQGAAIQAMSEFQFGWSQSFSMPLAHQAQHKRQAAALALEGGLLQSGAHPHTSDPTYHSIPNLNLASYH